MIPRKNTMREKEGRAIHHNNKGTIFNNNA